MSVSQPAIPQPPARGAGPSVGLAAHRRADSGFTDVLLNRRAADLLFSVPFAETGDPCLLYLLFEHQSTPDPRMPFRLLAI